MLYISTILFQFFFGRTKYFDFFPELQDYDTQTRSVEVRIMGGGEATHEFYKLKHLIEKTKRLAKDRNLTYHFSMPTNGIFGNTIRKYLTENLNSISLSFDGPAHIQNLHRPLTNGSDSFPIVFETANYFYKHRAPFALRATVSDYSLNYIEETVNFFSSNYPGISISLEPLSPVGRALKNNTVGPPDKNILANKMISLMKQYENKNIKLVNSSSSEYDVLRPAFCSSVAVPNWTVCVDGSIYCCERDDAPDEFLLGRFDFDRREIILDENKIQNVRKLNVFSYEECTDCFCKYHCAGDCPDRRLSEKTDCVAVRRVGKYVLSKSLNN